MIENQDFSPLLDESSKLYKENPKYLREPYASNGPRGISYQLLVLLSKGVKLLLKDKSFEISSEEKGYGNLDDLRIVLKDDEGRVSDVKGYQIKHYTEHPMVASDFYNNPFKSTRTDKNANIHIGKLFDGWLAAKKAHEGLDRYPSIIYFNTDVDDSLGRCIGEDRKFLTEWIEGREIISIDIQPKKSLKKINKNEFKKMGITTNLPLSEKIFEIIKSMGFVDDQKKITEAFLSTWPNSSVQAQFKKQFQSLFSKTKKSHFPKSKEDSAKEVMDHLTHRHANRKKDFVTNFYEYLYDQAWNHLRSKKRHKEQQKLSQSEKRACFSEFMRSVEFYTHQPDLEALQSDIQEGIVSYFNHKGEETIKPDALFFSLYFIVNRWFCKKYKDNQAPLLNRNIFESLLKRAFNHYQSRLILQGRSEKTLEGIQYSCQGKMISRKLPELDRFLTGTEPGVRILRGRKGVGKSGLIKQFLEKEQLSGYLFLSSTDVVGKKELRKHLMDVMEVNNLNLIVLDGAEALAKLDDTERSDFFENLSKYSDSKKILLNFAPDEGLSDTKNSMFDSLSPIYIELSRFSPEQVIGKYPQFEPYATVDNLMELACVPFYLNLILERLDNLNVNTIVSGVPLEAQLIRFAVEGKNQNNSQVRLFAWEYLATHLMKSADALNQSIPLEWIPPGIDELVSEGLILDDETSYRFSHDLFFDYAQMSIWFKEWQRALLNNKIDGFWDKLGYHSTPKQYEDLQILIETSPFKALHAEHLDFPCDPNKDPLETFLKRLKKIDKSISLMEDYVFPHYNFETLTDSGYFHYSPHYFLTDSEEEYTSEDEFRASLGNLLESILEESARKDKSTLNLSFYDDFLGSIFDKQEEGNLPNRQEEELLHAWSVLMYDIAIGRKIQRLSIHTPSNVLALNELSKSKSLQVLELGGKHFHQFGDCARIIEKNTSLKHFSVWTRRRGSDNAMASLGEALSNNLSLISLKVYIEDVSFEGVYKCIQSLSQNKVLMQLSMGKFDFDMDEEEFYELLSEFKGTNLDMLAIVFFDTSLKDDLLAVIHEDITWHPLVWETANGGIAPEVSTACQLCLLDKQESELPRLLKKIERFTDDCMILTCVDAPLQRALNLLLLFMIEDSDLVQSCLDINKLFSFARELENERACSFLKAQGADDTLDVPLNAADSLAQAGLIEKIKGNSQVVNTLAEEKGLKVNQTYKNSYAFLNKALGSATMNSDVIMGHVESEAEVELGMDETAYAPFVTDSLMNNARSKNKRDREEQKEPGPIRKKKKEITESEEVKVEYHG